MRAFLALPRIEQNELLNPLQLFDELFHGKIAPGGFGLAMHILQHRDAQHAVKGVDADLAVGLRPFCKRTSTRESLAAFGAASVSCTSRDFTAVSSRSRFFHAKKYGLHRPRSRQNVRTPDMPPLNLPKII